MVEQSTEPKGLVGFGLIQHRSWSGAASSSSAAEVQAAVAERTTPREHHLNEAPQVGNFGLYFGNWGKRPTAENNFPKRENIDAQIRKNPGQVIILTEAEAEIAEYLRLTAVAETPDLIEGNEDAEGLAKRPQYRHYVEQGADLLIAARTNSWAGVPFDCKKIHGKTEGQGGYTAILGRQSAIQAQRWPPRH